MIYLMCGCNFDPDLLDGYKELNEKYEDVKIIEVFGSMRNDPIGCSREEDRLPVVDYNSFARFCSKARDLDIKINYTINKSCVGSVEDFKKDEKNYLAFLEFLGNNGISRVTVTHPLLMELVATNTDFSIEASTICHTYSVNQVKYYSDLGVDKICMNLMKNRDITFLRNYNTVCSLHGITLELMANEACLFGCPYRFCHYNQQSHTIENKKFYDNYPIGRCTKIHVTERVEWLKARLIRPEDMKRYASIGINHFKITGRTHVTESQLRIAEYYMKQRLNGNFLDLFPQFYNIYKSKEEQKKAPFFIDNRDLDNFLDHWFDNMDFVCSDHCELNCYYCYDF